MDILVPSLRAVPHLTQLVGLASPKMSNLLHEGPCGWGIGAGVLTANGVPCPDASSWLTPLNWGPHSQSWQW